MISLKKAVLFGFFIWLIAFVVAFLIFPVHDSNRPFFESIMPVVIAFSTSYLALRYLRFVETDYQKESFLLGVVFILVNWIIDLPLMLSPSPMQMTLQEYISDIGITYFMIMPICLAIGCMGEHMISSE